MAKRRENKPVKVMYTDDNYKYYLTLLEALKLPYKMTVSNYTLDIESSFCNVYFMQNVMDKKAFLCGAMVKSDIIKSGIEKPEIDRDDLRYFDFNYYEILRKNDGKKIYNIDIKSAYANALRNNGLITDKTFGFLSTLSKKDRLAAVGMLASRKDVFHYDSAGDEYFHEKIIKDTENWFYFCVLKIQELMLDIKALIGADFLFYWVDGIFFTDIGHVGVIENYLRSKGYFNSFDECVNFRFHETDKNKSISYWKNGAEKAEFKRLQLPKVNSEAVKYLIKHLKLVE